MDSFDVHDGGNLGQSDRMLQNCVTGRDLPSRMLSGFRATVSVGWQGNDGGWDACSTAYYDHMARFGFDRARAPRLASSWP